MSNIALAFLYAEEPELDPIRPMALSFEEQVLAALPPEFFVGMEVDCAHCGHKTNLFDADIRPWSGYICLCPACSPAPALRYALS